MSIVVKLKNNGKIYQPVVKDGAMLTRKKNAASTFDFTVLNDETLQIEEGDVITVTSDD